MALRLGYNRPTLLPFHATPAMSTRSTRAIALFGLLALVMAATRIHHFAAIPDASWAVFFAGGFYLRAQWRWAFPALIAVAFLADWYAIAAAGIDFLGHYCVSPAYWFLLPAYLSLWLGGAWLAARRPGLRWRSLGQLALALLVSVSLCYVLSNGSFYWLSDSWGGADAQRSLGGWFANMGHWYLAFLRTTAMYVAGAALLHATALAAARPSATASHAG